MLVAILTALVSVALLAGVLARQVHRLRQRVAHLERAQEVNLHWRENLAWRVEKIERRARGEPVEEDEADAFGNWFLRETDRQGYRQ